MVTLRIMVVRKIILYILVASSSHLPAMDNTQIAEDTLKPRKAKQSKVNKYPLRHAILDHDPDKVKHLISMGLDINKPDYKSRSPLFFAINEIIKHAENSESYEKLQKIIELLLARPNIKLSSKLKQLAIKHEKINDLIQKHSNNYNYNQSTMSPPNQNTTDHFQFGNLYLYPDTTQQNETSEQIICDSNFDVNAYDQYGHTPLMRAVMQCDVENTRNLLQYKNININLKRKTNHGCEKKTALIIAIKKIRNYKVDINSISYKKLKDIIQLLLDHPDVNLSRFDPITGRPNKPVLEVAQDFELPEIETMITAKLWEKQNQSVQPLSAETSNIPLQEITSDYNLNHAELVQAPESMTLYMNTTDKNQEIRSDVALSQIITTQSIESSSNSQNFRQFLSSEELMKELEKTKSQIEKLQSDNDRLQNEVEKLKLNQEKILKEFQEATALNLFKTQLAQCDTISFSLIAAKRINGQPFNGSVSNPTNSEQNEESLTKKPRSEK